jgi:hypothetical protein
LLFALQLPASRGNIITAGPPDVNLNSALVERLLKALNALVGGPLEDIPGMGVKRNHVHLTADAAEKIAQRLGAFDGIVDTAEQDLLEGDALAPGNRQRAATIH